MTCPRCKGFVQIARDPHGTFRECINCGWLYPIDSYDPEGKPGPRTRRSHKRARPIAKSRR